MNIETNEMFWDKLKNVLKDAFSKKEDLAANSGFTNVENYEKEVEAIKEEFEAEPTPEPTVEPQNEPQTEPEPTPVKEEENNEPVEPTVEEKEEPTVEQPKQDNHLEDLIKNLQEEIKALKESNDGLQNKLKEMSKQPSANPVNVNAKPSATDNYSAWREQMRSYIG